ncbi:hypothetical protein ACOKFD_15070 [Flagellimonas sp. S174]|uniref:hypothetical protein n=1 Tax=Flagellimonas sp. S174 TaxID=3410790 RepID=UPI003BF469BF
MNYKRSLRVHNKRLTGFFLPIFYVLFISCGENSKNPPSELIKKINAVQQQVMAQGNITEEEELAMSNLCSIMSQDDGLANFNSDDRIILDDAEIAPVYKGCENLSKDGIRECFNTKVVTYIKGEFNLNVSKDLNLSEPKQVEAFFIINEDGNSTGIKVRDSELTVQAEILRVLRKMPIMKPAIQNGKSVSVLCSILVKYGNDIEVDVVYIPEIPND